MFHKWMLISVQNSQCRCTHVSCIIPFSCCLQVDQLSNAALELISEITRKADEEHAATLERNRATLEGIMDQDAPADLKRKVLATVHSFERGPSGAWKLRWVACFCCGPKHIIPSFALRCPEQAEVHIVVSAAQLRR